MSAKITQKTIGSLPDGRHLLDPNLFLVVRRDGASRTYVFRYTINGRRRDLSLGSATVKPLAVVRQEAIRLRLLVSQGIDPKEQRDEERRAAIAGHAGLLTFRDYALSIEEALAKMRRWAVQSRKVHELYLRRYAYPVIGEMPLTEIGVPNVVSILEPIWIDHPITAWGVRRAVEAVFSYARRDGLYTGPNPATWNGNLDAYFTPINKFHACEHRYSLSKDALRAALKRAASRLLISDYLLIVLALTASRRDESRLLKWSEVNFVTRRITIPPERRKDRKLEPHLIPMSDQLWLLLQKIPRNGTENVFFGETSASGVIDELMPLKAIKRHADDKKATLHGLRSTFREWCAENGKDPILAEKALMHATGNSVQQAYQRSDLVELRRPLMQEWADEILPMETVREVLHTP